MLLRLQRLILCFVVMAAIVAMWGMPKFWSAARQTGVPFGVAMGSGSQVLGAQDFAFHLNFLRQIWRETVKRPYRLEDQEKMVKRWFPRMPVGMPHAYSPVALVLALPFLAMSPESAYFAITLLNAALLVLLTAFYLVPRMKNGVQAAAVMASFCGYVLFDVFLMGQTAILTTSCLAAGFALLELRGKRAGQSRLAGDALLGILLFLLAVKPSVALVLAALLIGERVWVAFLTAGAGLAVAWLTLAGHYGGYVLGLQDYFWILNHYCQADMTPFMRPWMAPGISTNFTSCLTVLAPEHNAAIFFTSRVLFEGLILGLVVARLLGRISLSTQFQGLLWTFLLFCPHLLVTEDFAICLLVVEGTFFRPGWGAPLKILLVFLLVNLCMGTWTTLPLFFVVKLALAGWWLGEQVARRGQPESCEK